MPLVTAAEHADHDVTEETDQPTRTIVTVAPLS
jgi:hypothetical protein